MRAKYQIPQKYCTPVILDRFVCALLSFCAREFPAKSETREPGKIIVECTSYGDSVELHKVHTYEYKRNMDKNKLGVV